MSSKHFDYAHIRLLNLRRDTELAEKMADEAVVSCEERDKVENLLSQVKELGIFVSSVIYRLMGMNPHELWYDMSELIDKVTCAHNLLNSYHLL